MDSRLQLQRKSYERQDEGRNWTSLYTLRFKVFDLDCWQERDLQRCPPDLAWPDGKKAIDCCANHAGTQLRRYGSFPRKKGTPL